jgi:deoxyribodipyrimidine photolyase-related protein
MARAPANPGDGGVDRLVVVFGDQLDAGSGLLRGLDAGRDVVLMMEVVEESTHVPSHVQRTVVFLAAMRHFAAELRGRGVKVRYVELDDPENTGTFCGETARAVEALRPGRVVMTLPGEWRVLNAVRGVGKELGVPVEVLPDTHFVTPVGAFEAWAKGRSALTMEYFYREQRRRTGYLMVGAGAKATPEGGVWNFDKENRLPFGKEGPRPMPPLPPVFEPDAVVRGVMKVVGERLPGLPGKAGGFAWPVTRVQALVALERFVAERLALFGPYEDAMWAGSPFVYHSALSVALNLKLLNPRECCEAAIGAYRAGRAPLRSVEAFVRQLIGWREYIRGVYWLEGPGYAERNGLEQSGRLPEFYWTGETDMACLRQCVGEVLERSFGHHIQRLMVTGNFALIAGVHPRAVSDWYLGMYADGVDWVTLPNALGMVMHADRREGAAAGTTGVVGTKPYAAGGRYIDNMSNYCRGCRFEPTERSGERACPFTVFYWDFLLRNQERLGRNHRMGVVVKAAAGMTAEVKARITVDARALRRKYGIEAAPGELSAGAKGGDGERGRGRKRGRG